MKKKELEAVIHESEAVQEAIKAGVPQEEAAHLYVGANKKAESGEWLDLYHQESRYGKSEYHPHSTSLVRFWGPAKYLEGKERLSRSQAERLFEKGLIGKTHELVRGSRDYGNNYEKVEGRWRKKLHEGRIPESSPGGAYPPIGSRVLHRHWEIEQMYRHKKRKDGGLERKMVGIFLLLVLGGLGLIYFGRGAHTGYAVLDSQRIISLPFVLFILAFCVLVPVFVRKLFK